MNKVVKEPHKATKQNIKPSEEHHLDLQELRNRLRHFAEERDWDQFHSPKNLAMALIVEAGELVEHFQWLTEEDSTSLSEAELAKVAEEIADIQIYLVRLADKLGIDILAAAEAKLRKNDQKYPADIVKGSSKKYSEYKDPPPDP